MGCESSDASGAGVPHSIFPSNFNESKFDSNYYKLLQQSILLDANKLFAHDQFSAAATIYQQYIEDHGT